jgi:hypothetical protein
VILTREVYEDQPIDGKWMYGYEDYEWFWRVTKAGHRILFTDQLTGQHHHRRSFRHLVLEYRRAAHGCANFIKTHPDSPLARKRRQQAMLLPSAGLAGLATAGTAVVEGQWIAVTMVIAAGMGLLMAREFASSRTAESLAYPIAGGTLGVVFTLSVARGLLFGTGSRTAAAPAWDTATPPRRRICWPLVALLALQAGLSLSLVWSNTAFGDEALYLWAGHLELAHWLHGFPLPTGGGYYSDFSHIFSGAPMIYPPLGALADSLGGLAAARILSLAFMLGATALLYSVAARMFGTRAALIAAAIWAVSEPVLRLSFATYDSMSVFLVSVAVWMAIQAPHKYRRGERILAAAFFMAAANVVAYSSAVADPVFIAFVLMAYIPVLGRRQAISCAAWLAAALAFFVGLLPTALHLWPGIIHTVLARAIGRSGYLLILRDTWLWTGMILVLALLGLAVAIGSKEKRHLIALLAVMFVGAVIIPVEQMRLETATALDKHAALGLWFATMGAGYAIDRLATLQLPDARPVVTAAIATVAVLFPGISGWTAAYAEFHIWPNANQFVAAFKSEAAATSGKLAAEGVFGPAAGGRQVLEYYTAFGHQWWRWTGLSLAPTSTPPSKWREYYRSQLRHDDLGTVALFYNVGMSSESFGTLLFRDSPGKARQILLHSAVNSRVPGLIALTQAIESDHSYRLATSGSYGSSSTYVIWQRSGAAG